MAQAFVNYNPDRVVTTFGDVLRGFAPGTFIKVSPLAAKFTSRSGADRLVSHTRTNDDRVKIEITLMAGSSSNTYLSGIHEADQSAANGAGVLPFSLADLNGSTIVECAYCRIMESPEQEFSNENDGDRVWVLEGVKAAQVVGGR